MSYFVQGCWNNGILACEERVDNPTPEDSPLSLTDLYAWEKKALRIARALVADNTFEGDYVRVITSDGELIWDSRKDEEKSNANQ